MNKAEVLGSEVLLDVTDELVSATSVYGPMTTAHEGYAVILEEVDELKAEVWKKHKDPARMREEAIQIAAMAMRFVIDICDKNPAINLNANDL
jgi:hypothetical protein